MRTIGRLLSDAVARSPDAVYLIAEEEEYSFQEVGDRSVAAALALWASGVTRGDRVAVVADGALDALAADPSVRSVHLDRPLVSLQSTVAGAAAPVVKTGAARTSRRWDGGSQPRLIEKI